MRPFPRSAAFGHGVSRFSNFAVFLESCCTFIHQSRERSTRELFISAFQLIASHLYISTEGGGPLVDSIKGYPKEFYWSVTRSWWLEGWFWKLSRPIPLLHFFLQWRANAYGKHAPDMQSVALHYIHLRAAISGRKSAGRGGSHHHTLALQEEKGKGNKPWTIASFWNI